MNVEDLMTGDEFAMVREALESSFRELTLAHEAALTRSLQSWQERQRAEKDGADEARLAYLRQQAMHRHYMADVLKALMWARFPEGSLAWFGAEEA